MVGPWLVDLAGTSFKLTLACPLVRGQEVSLYSDQGEISVRWEPSIGAFFLREQGSRLERVLGVQKTGRTEDLCPGDASAEICMTSCPPSLIKCTITPDGLAAPRQKQKNSDQRTDVRSPLTGSVLKVLVSQGEQVQSGQGIAVIEAMKMENEIAASEAGIVSDILVEAGQAIRAGVLIARIRRGEKC